MRRCAALLAFAVLSLALTAPRARAHPGSGLVIDARGTAYATDVVRNVVWRIHPDGRVERYLEGLHSHQLWLDADGHLRGEHLDYRADEAAFYFSYWQKAPDQPLRWTHAPSRTRQLPVMRPVRGVSYLWQGDNNRRTRSALVAVSASGTRREVVGGPYGHADGPAPLARLGTVSGLCLAPDGALYFSDGAGLRVLRDGRISTLVAHDTLLTNALGGGGNYVFALVATRTGGLLVANYGNGQVLSWQPGQGLRARYAASGAWSPVGVAERADGSLYVLENAMTPGRTERLRLVWVAGSGPARPRVLAEW